MCFSGMIYGFGFVNTDSQVPVSICWSCISPCWGLQTTKIHVLLVEPPFIGPRSPFFTSFPQCFSWERRFFRLPPEIEAPLNSFKRNRASNNSQSRTPGAGSPIVGMTLRKKLPTKQSNTKKTNPTNKQPSNTFRNTKGQTKRDLEC